MKPLEYLRILSPPTEDTRAVVTAFPPELLGCKPIKGDGGPRSTYEWCGWTGTKWANGCTRWQTKECWNRPIVDFPPDSETGMENGWHVTRRDVAVDLEVAQTPEQHWAEWFGGTRGKATDADGNVMSWPGGTQCLRSNSRGTGCELGSRRSGVFMRIYTKFLKMHVAVKVRQIHFDKWTEAGWGGGMVARVEFELKPPTPLDGPIEAMWADAAARIRLMERPKEPRERAADIPTAERWTALGAPLKRERPRAEAPNLAALRLHRAIERLRKEHGDSAVRLAVMCGVGASDLRQIMGRSSK